MRKLVYFFIAAANVWASHATKLESADYTAMQLINVIIMSLAGGAVAVRALMDNNQNNNEK